MKQQIVVVTGGAGYVGAVLVPKLLARGFCVRVVDLMIYGDDVFDDIADRSALEIFKGDIRDPELLASALSGADFVIHLACISNDPSFDLDPTLGRSINFDSFRPLVELSRAAGVRRFVYASSSSVYGVKAEPRVHEGMTLEPLTDYSRFKAACEEVLSEYQADDFTTVTLRPATVCGVSPRQRLDLIVNILTNHAVNNRRIKVFGGSQKRPNIHIDDMTDAYLQVLDAPADRVAGQIFNVGYGNQTVDELATTVRDAVGPDVQIETTAMDDPRSYHISSQKIREVLGFEPRRAILDAVADLTEAFEQGRLPEPMTDARYFNIKMMQRLGMG